MQGRFLARTILDVAGVARPGELAQAFGAAVRLREEVRAELRVLLNRYPRRRGTGALRVPLDADEPPVLVRSEVEAWLVRLLRRARLPVPETNVTLEAGEVDMLWRAQGVIVEVDGFAYHGSRRSFEADRRRDAASPAATGSSASRGSRSWPSPRRCWSG